MNGWEMSLKMTKYNRKPPCKQIRKYPAPHTNIEDSINQGHSVMYAINERLGDCYPENKTLGAVLQMMSWANLMLTLILTTTISHFNRLKILLK